MKKRTQRLFPFPAAAAAAHILQNSWIWEQSHQRQQRIAPFQDSKAALVLYNEGNALSYIPRFHPEARPLLDLVLPCLQRIQQVYGRGYWCKVMFAKLPRGGRIKPHFDKGWPLAFEHRFHWVIATNPETRIEVGGEIFQFAQDEVWEINNRENHSVLNGGATDRIHMIADFVPEPGEAMHYWSPYEPNSAEDLFYHAVDRAREQWGSQNNPLY